MHVSGLHYYNPKDEQVIFINTVSSNKQSYSKQQIKGAETARVLYAKLVYPSVKDFRWIIISNQIQDCPVTVQDINISHTIWDKNIAALKGKTTQRKPIPVAGNWLKVPTELLKLHKDVFMTVNFFFKRYCLLHYVKS